MLGRASPFSVGIQQQEAKNWDAVHISETEMQSIAQLPERFSRQSPGTQKEGRTDCECSESIGPTRTSVTVG